MDAWEKFKKTVVKEKLVSAGDRVLLAVSGGPDSVCLMHLFWRLKKTLPVGIQLLYMDHGLRAQAAGEKKLVRRYGRTLQLPATIVSLPVRETAAAERISIETAGRNLRYRALAAQARAAKCNRIATGHTASDNAETIIMWLLRGTGPEGLAGIPLTRDCEGIEVIRPLLPVTREEITDYVKRQRLSFAVDSSNYQLDYTRNKIRHRIIPALRELSPRLVEHLFNLSRIVSAENDFLERLTARAKKRAVSVGGNTIILDLKLFFRYNKIIQSRVLKEILPERRSLMQVERLREWIFSSAREMGFSRSWHVRKRKNALVFKSIRGASDKSRETLPRDKDTHHR